MVVSMDGVYAGLKCRPVKRSTNVVLPVPTAPRIQNLMSASFVNWDRLLCLRAVLLGAGGELSVDLPALPGLLPILVLRERWRCRWCVARSRSRRLPCCSLGFFGGQRRRGRAQSLALSIVIIVTVSTAAVPSNMAQCGAIVFDMDGLMIDSEPLWHIAIAECFEKVSVALTHNDLLETTGLRIDEVVEHNYQKHNWDESTLRTRSQVTTDIVDTMERLLTEKAATIRKPGLDQALAFFKTKHLPMGLASSSPMRLINAALKGLELQDFFQVVVSAEGEKLGKPYPGVYLTAAAQLGVSADKCLALEDSLNGTLAAKAARMKCISIPEAETPSLGFHIADVQLKSLEEINQEMWTGLWGGEE
jgi:HAD superfamily hydrolase (TIGR01509 family)